MNTREQRVADRRAEPSRVMCACMPLHPPTNSPDIFDDAIRRIRMSLASDEKLCRHKHPRARRALFNDGHMRGVALPSSRILKINSDLAA